jgi:hypothetical protein
MSVGLQVALRQQSVACVRQGHTGQAQVGWIWPGSNTVTAARVILGITHAPKLSQYPEVV